MDKKFSGPWQVAIGEGFGFDISYANEKYPNFSNHSLNISLKLRTPASIGIKLVPVR